VRARTWPTWTASVAKCSGRGRHGGIAAILKPVIWLRNWCATAMAAMPGGEGWAPAVALAPAPPPGAGAGAAAGPVRLMVDGVEVCFPFKPYPSQISMMSKVRPFAATPPTPPVRVH
jgi:hypothetical protein